MSEYQYYESQAVSLLLQLSDLAEYQDREAALRIVWLPSATATDAATAS